MDRVEASTPPPIFKLSHDVLLEIFTLVIHKDLWRGAHRYMYRDAFSISRVCSYWRRIMLQAPSLWAVINLSMLEKTSRRWKKEVMGRTKQSPLILGGYLSRFAEPEILSFFKSVVRDEWSRIETVDLVISPEILHRTSVDIDELRELFSRPAPILSSFSFTVDRSRYDDILPFSPIPIFLRGEAPALTEFESKQFCLGMEGFRYLSHLSCLTIYFPPTALQVLELLQYIPSLTSLALQCNHVPSKISQDLPYVTPPNLLFISIKFLRGTFIPFIDLLDHIQPLRRTVLHLSCRLARLRNVDDLFQMDASQEETFRRVLQKFFSSAFGDMNQGPLFTTIGIYLYAFKVTTCCLDPKVHKPPPHHCAFTFSVILPEYGSLSDTDISVLMSLFSSCDFSNIKQAELDGDLRFALLSADGDPRTLFYRQLVSLERVAIGVFALPHFSNVNLNTMFPNLKVLEVKWCVESRDRARLLSVMENWHLPATSMVRTVHFSDAVVDKMDLSFLDEVIGLRVTWRADSAEGEYTCGTGNPHILDFSRCVDHDSLEIDLS